MKNFTLFAGIPLALFSIFIVLPKLVMFLFNSHTFEGIAAIILLLAVVFGFIGSKAISFFNKRNKVNEDE